MRLWIRPRLSHGDTLAELMIGCEERIPPLKTLDAEKYPWRDLYQHGGVEVRWIRRIERVKSSWWPDNLHCIIRNTALHGKKYLLTVPILVPHRAPCIEKRTPKEGRRWERRWRSVRHPEERLKKTADSDLLQRCLKSPRSPKRELGVHAHPVLTGLCGAGLYHLKTIWSCPKPPDCSKGWGQVQYRPLKGFKNLMSAG